MLDTMGVILACNNEADLGELTRVRSVAAVPFAGRYRLVDFILSGMVNSGIINIGVATDYNYQSLLDHLGSGKPWDLARKKYGLFILPPFTRRITEEGDARMSILIGILHYMKRSGQKYIIVADCNNVCNIRFDDILTHHTDSCSDITVVYQQTDGKNPGTYLDIDKEGNVNGFIATSDAKKKVNRAVGYYVFNKDFLINSLERCQLLGKTDFVKDVIGWAVSKLKVTGYLFSGYLSAITDTDSYYRASMDLLDVNTRKQLFISDDRILTKTKDKVPTRYKQFAEVSDSMIADGCVIDGKVENSILFRGVTVEKGAVIKNSIIMQDSLISENVRLGACILDKNCIVRKDKELIGQSDFPIVVGKRRTV